VTWGREENAEEGVSERPTKTNVKRINMSTNLREEIYGTTVLKTASTAADTGTLSLEGSEEVNR